MAEQKAKDDIISLTRNLKVNSIISVLYGAAIIVWPELLGRTIGLYLVVTGFLNLVQRKH